MIKYLGSFGGPTYGYIDQSSMDGYHTLFDAMKAMRNRLAGGSVDIGYKEDSDGYYRRHSPTTGYFQTLATTGDECIDLYEAVWDAEEEGYILGSWVYRITVGPRGGVRSQKVN